MVERIQKILASRGVASRRHCEELIVQGRVTSNGEVCILGQSADPDRDEILLDGLPIPEKRECIYLLLNKPKGYVTTLRDEKGRKNVAQLVSGCGRRVYPVGRLDMDSEGLLLMTDDGAFADALMHPKHEVNKVYRVTVDGFSKENLEKLALPIVLDGYRIRSPKIALVRETGKGAAELLITIHEGRNRQVRRMCAAAGMKVRRLIRISEGPLQLGNLAAGEWRYLTLDEVSSLR